MLLPELARREVVPRIDSVTDLLLVTSAGLFTILYALIALLSLDHTRENQRPSVPAYDQFERI